MRGVTMLCLLALSACTLDPSIRCRYDFIQTECSCVDGTWQCLL